MNKGFTLVELLAVIIILGVLTLVTVVSVNPILKDAKKGLTDTQIDNIEEVASLYYIKYGVGLDDFELENPKDCINVSELIETGYIENEEVTNPKTGEKILGSVKVTYNSNNYIYEYQDNACTNYDKGIICERVESTLEGNVPEGNFAAGDAYNCKVDPNRDPYKFYVLTTPDEDSNMVNLIMDRNINSDGSPAGDIAVPKGMSAEKYNLVVWNTGSSNIEGPVGAMNFIYNATKEWANVEPLTYDYNDKDYQGTTEEATSYLSFVSNDGVLTIKPLLGEGITIGTINVPLRARMPIYSSVFNDSLDKKISEKGEVADKTTANTFLYTNITGSGYWTLSSSVYYSNRAWAVNKLGSVSSHSVYLDGFCGVRPVISMYKFQME